MDLRDINLTRYKFGEKDVAKIGKPLTLYFICPS